VNTSFFHDMLGSIAERGRALLDRTSSRPEVRAETKAPETLESLSRALLSGRGEASGVALARQLLDRYAGEPTPARIEFFRLMAREFDPDPTAIGRAWDHYRQDSSPRHLQDLLEAVEPPRQELFRRLNLAPGGTAALVAMREDLIKHGKEPDLRKVDDDFAHLFRLLVQSRLPAPAPDRLVNAGRHPGADHPLRGRARDPGLGRSASPSSTQ
jgi:malonyl-CoA decarboxylase